jgi:glycosyltransferase involved in cell wall biosynthesis
MSTPKSLATELNGPTSEKPLNVIIVNDFASITGGADKVALTEAAGLARRGHRVTLLAGRGEPDAEMLAAGVEVRTTGQQTILDDPNRVRAAGRGIWNRASAELVESVARVAEPRSTVVHVHGFTKVLSASVIRAAVRSGLPTVATLHDYFVACPNGGFFIYPRDEVCHLVPLSPRCIATNCDARTYSHKLWRVTRTAVQRGGGMMPRGVRQFIAPSRFAAEIVRRFLPPSAQLHIVANPIPAPRLPLAEIAQNDAFLFVGRMQRDKDPLTFARAAKRSEVRAVFAGAGEAEEPIQSEFPAAELRGWLGPEEMLSQVRAARALVCPSSWYEVQPLVPLEAAAQGVPAIVSNAGAFREAVADGETGLWFRSGDADDLAEKLARLQRDPELATHLGRAAYERFWAQDWSVDAHLDRLESIYSCASSA